MRSSSNPRARRGVSFDEPIFCQHTLSVAAAVVAAGVVGAAASSDASRKASNKQQNAANAGINQQNIQFEAVQKLLEPYVKAGTGALTGQQDLIGINGADAQSKAITALQGSPQFTSLLKAGNDNILANASATGGLRGGNTQGALAQFSPQLLNQIIDQQYARLGGLTSIGQNAAAGVGNAGMATGNQISALLQQQGAAAAGGALADGRAWAGGANAVAGGIGYYNARNPGVQQGYSGDTGLSNADLAAKYGF